MVENKEIGSTPLFHALSEVKKLFSIEAELVKPSAEHHGVSIIEGNILTPMTKHAYNPRVPEATKEEFQSIGKAKHFAIICEDYRQSYEVVETLDHPDVVLSTAGGPDQPESNRRHAIARLMKESYLANPTITFDMVFHNGICGGCKHFTNGETARIRETKGIDAENNIMQNFAMDLVGEAIAHGVPNEAMKLYRANIGETDAFEGLTALPVI